MKFEALFKRAAAAGEAARDRRLRRIEAALREIDGVSVERSGETLTLAGRGLRRRSIEDVRLRFAGDGR